MPKKRSRKSKTQNRHDNQVLASYRWQECIVCGESGQTCAHHIKTKKAYPQYKFSLWNLMPVCWGHHEEVHRLGLREFANLYPNVESFLVANGWEFCPIAGKWLHD